MKKLILNQVSQSQGELVITDCCGGIRLGNTSKCIFGMELNNYIKTINELVSDGLLNHNKIGGKYGQILKLTNIGKKYLENALG